MRNGFYHNQEHNLVYSVHPVKSSSIQARSHSMTMPPPHRKLSIYLYCANTIQIMVFVNRSKESTSLTRTIAEKQKVSLVEKGNV